MARPPMFKAQEKQRIVLSVLRGECTMAEAARRTSARRPRSPSGATSSCRAVCRRSRTSPGRGRPGVRRSWSAKLAEVTSALGEAHVELRLLKRDGAAGFASRSWR